MVVVCCSSWFCLLMAANTSGWQWPTLTVTIPAKACRHRSEHVQVSGRGGHMWVRWWCTAATHVQEAAPTLIKQVLHFALHDHDGLFEMVEQSCESEEGHM